MAPNTASESHPSPVDPRVSEHEALVSAGITMDRAIVAHAGYPQRWAEGLLLAIRELTSAVERHRAIAEASGGTIERMAERRPELLERIHAQSMEHGSLVAALAAFEAEICVEISRHHIAVEPLRAQASDLMRQVRLHQARGGDLLHEALFREGAPTP